MAEISGFMIGSYVWAFVKIFLGWLINIYVIGTIIYFYKNKKEFKKLGWKKILIISLIVTVLAIVLSEWF